MKDYLMFKVDGQDDTGMWIVRAYKNGVMDLDGYELLFLTELEAIRAVYQLNNPKVGLAI
jgi:hypothetical protein